MSDRYNGIGDEPNELPDFNDAHADDDNKSGITGGYQHRPVTREQLQAGIDAKRLADIKAHWDAIDARDALKASVRS